MTDLLERETGDVPSSGSQLTLDVGPFQIVTLKLERA